MPELPDVENFRNYLNATALHKPVEKVEVRNEEILQGISGHEFASALEGQAFETTQRHGKYLFIQLTQPGWLGVHFGMTGFWQYFANAEKEPPHTRILFHFRNGYSLAYDAQRKLGFVTLLQDVEQYVKEKELGPDALDDAFDFEAFYQTVANRRGMVKSVLMQQNILAGIGNIYADEILFQARLHPKARLKQLDRDQLKTLFQAIKEVLQTAIDCQADPSRLPDSFLLTQRHEHGHCPECGGTVEKITVSGRNGWYCPACQSR